MQAGKHEWALVADLYFDLAPKPGHACLPTGNMLGSAPIGGLGCWAPLGGGRSFFASVSDTQHTCDTSTHGSHLGVRRLGVASDFSWNVACCPFRRQHSPGLFGLGGRGRAGRPFEARFNECRLELGRIHVVDASLHCVLHVADVIAIGCKKFRFS